MLRITIPATELWDERNERIIRTKEQTLQLEHSLVSISKWEMTWGKPFLSKETKTVDETIDYVRCMTLTQNVNPNVYFALNDEVLKQVNDYIDNPMTATTFSEDKSGRPNREIITAEIVYYWMSALQIPMDCQKWHFNRLLAYIRVCNIKNQPPKKMGQAEMMRRNTALNAARRQQLNTKG